MNLPNTITLCRLGLTAIFVGGTAMESVLGHWIALVAFVIAAISDCVLPPVTGRPDIQKFVAPESAGRLPTVRSP